MGYPRDLNSCVCQLRRNSLEDGGGCDVHVSHKMGNSLCSHPALLISDLGGICRVGLKPRDGKLRKVEVSVCSKLLAAEVVDRLSQRTPRETLGETDDPDEARFSWYP